MNIQPRSTYTAGGTLDDDPPPPLPLAFQRELVTEVLSEDSGLVVIARGLGCTQIIRFFVETFAKPTCLVFVLDAGRKSTAPDAAIVDVDGTGMLRAHVHVVTAETNAQQRQQSYLKGGVFLVTPQILVADMLNNVVPIHLITGFLIRNAERVTDLSTEAWILRLFRQGNQAGFIRAFSERPEPLVTGFAALERTLKNLQVRKVFAWPRFHVHVAENLAAQPVDTVELHVDMTPSMQLAQSALLRLISMCIAELRPLLPDLAFESFEEGTGADVDPNLEVALDNPTTRRRRTRFVNRSAAMSLADAYVNYGPAAIGLVRPPPPGTRARGLWHDLQLLRALLDYLAEYDAVSFLTFLETVYAECAPGTGSVFRSAARECMWILTDEAANLLTVSRERVYRTVAALEDDVDRDAHLRRAEHATGTRATLEVLPKWQILRSVLEEVHADPVYRDPETGAPTAPDGHRTRILIVCRERKAAAQIGSFLVSGEAGIKRHFLRYLEWKGKLKGLEDLVRGSGTGPAAEEQAPARRTTASAPVLPGSIAAKRRRVRGPQAVPEVPSARRATANPAQPMDPLSVAVRSAEAVLYQALFAEDESSGVEGSAAAEGESEDEDSAEDGAHGDDEEEEEEEEEEEPTHDSTLAPAPPFVAHDSEIYVRVASHINSDHDDRMLAEVRPDVIILYDALPSLVRQIELYQATRRSDVHLRTYFVVYRDSTEEQRYLAQVRRERDAFERIIRTAATMVIPLTVPSAGDAGLRTAGVMTHDDLESRQRGAASVSAANASLAGPRSVRDAAGASGAGSRTLTPPTVIVDIREFRADLPAALALHAGLRVVPCTLEVGDYILAPSIAVERKSLPDLVQSLASGRLYAQAAAMSRAYPTPVLLIEVDRPVGPAGNPPSLSLFGGGGTSIETTPISASSVFSSPQDAIPAKLALLTIHFPKLRVVWSSGAAESALLLAELKAGHAEPDAAAAMAVDATALGMGGEAFHAVPHAILRPILRHPPAERPVMRRAVSVADLVARATRVGGLVDVISEPKVADDAAEFIKQTVDPGLAAAAAAAAAASSAAKSGGRGRGRGRGRGKRGGRGRGGRGGRGRGGARGGGTL
ncbi:DNA repair protein RAD16 [Blastocladiella emersonii ATCC 22665]|nr:DNA repair protein RAD16 [Blastocladiella emersonii ATCC 22665]